MKNICFRYSWSALLLAAITLDTILLMPHTHAQAQVKDRSRNPIERSSPVERGLSLISAPNPYYRTSPGRRIDTIVIHYISGINVDPGRWDDPQLAMQILRQNHVSAHYLVARDGIVYKLVDERNVAWHAGGSIMPTPDNRHNVNSYSIGIENIATAKSGFTESQYQALASLVDGIRSRYHITHIVGHDEIAGRRATGMGLRPDVKEDPGPLFDWSRIPGR